MRFPARAAMLAPIASLIALMVVAGCGGGGGRNAAAPGGDSPGQYRGKGGLTLNVLWPERTRLIPDVTEFIVVTVTKNVPGDPPVVPIPPQTLTRPAPGQPLVTTARFPDLEVDSPDPAAPTPYTVTATAYPDADRNGALDPAIDRAVATATVAFSLTDGEDEQVPVTMGTTITSIDLQQLPDPLFTPLISMRTGQTRPLTVVARDAANNVVLLSQNQVTFTTDRPDLITIAENTVPGTGNIPDTGATITVINTPPTGSARVLITVTDPESGISATETITIGATGIAETSWPKFRGDLQNTGMAGPLVTGSSGNGTGSVFFNAGSAINLASPAIGPDPGGNAGQFVVYIGAENGTVYAINSDGTLRWSFPTGSAIESTPLVGKDGTVYVSSTDGVLYALSADTGTIPNPAAPGTQMPIWRFPGTGAISGAFFASPTMDTSSRIFIGAARSADGSRTADAGKFYCIDGFTGQMLWAQPFQAGEEIQSTAALSLDQQTAYFGAFNGTLYAVNTQTGTALWTAATADAIFGSPAVSPLNGDVVIGSLDGRVYAFNGTTGALSGGSWPFDPGNIPDPSSPGQFLPAAPFYASPAIAADGSIYIGAFDIVSGNDVNLFYGLNPDGTAKWPGLFFQTIEPNGGIVSSAAITPDGFAIFGANDTNVYAVDLADGTLKATGSWPFNAGGAVESSPAFAADGRVFVGSADGNVYVIQ